MIVKHTKPTQEMLPGLGRKTLAHGEKGLMTQFKLKAGAELPAHSHPHEQIGYLVSGRIVLDIGGEKQEMEPGDSWAIPGDMVHSALTLEDAVAIEVFVPVREDYLD